MNIQEAIKTNQYVSRPLWENQAFCHYLPNTGPYKDLVSCDYFVFYEDGFLSFSTSGPDLYAEDISANDYEISKLTQKDIDEAYINSQKLK